jgi:hypothetical protein
VLVFPGPCFVFEPPRSGASTLSRPFPVSAKLKPF